MRESALEQRTTARGTPRNGALRALRHRDFRLFWCGIGLAHLGYDVQRVGLGVLAYELTGSAFVLTLILAGDALPMVVLSPLGGALGDRLNRRTLMMACRGTVAVLALAVAVLTATGWVATWHLLAYALLAGVCYALDVPARQVVVRDLVPGQDFVNAVALTASLRQASRIIGPLIGSGALLLAGTGATFALMAVGQLGLLTMLALVELPLAHHRNVERTATVLREGFRFIVREEAVWTLLIVAAIPPLFGMAYQSLIPVFARDILGQGRAAIGVMLTAAGIGALSGSALVAAYPERLGRPRGAVAAVIVFGLMVAAFAGSRGYVLSLGLLLAIGGASSAVVVITTTAVQQRTPPALQGRVMGVYQVTWELQVCGALATGALADIAGAPLALALTGLVSVAAAGALVARRPGAWRV